MTRVAGFLGSVESAALLRFHASPSRLGVNEATDFPMASTYLLGPGHPTPGPPILLRHRVADNVTHLVQEYSPVAHRLRLSASA